jgi:hypothetical protein
MGASNCIVCGVIRRGTPPHMNVVHNLPTLTQWRQFRIVKSLPGGRCTLCDWTTAGNRGSWSATWKHEVSEHPGKLALLAMHDPKWEAQWQEIQTARNGTGPKKVPVEPVPAKLADQYWGHSPTEAIPEPVTVEPKSAGGMLAGLIEDISLVLNEVEYYKARCTDLEVQVRKATEREVKVAKEIQGLFDRLRG